MNLRATVPTFRFHARHLLAALLPALCVSAYASKDQVPDWVRAAAAQTLPHYPEDTNAVVLLDETTFTVGNDGRAVEHNRHVVKILRPGGRDEGIVHIPFDKDSKILSLHVWSIGPDGHEYAVKDNEISEIGLPGEGALYDDIKYRVASPPGRDPGGIVAYEYEQRARPYIQEETWEFEDNLPHLHQSFTLQIPPGYTYGTVWAHHEKQAVIDLENQHYRWQIDDTPGIDVERVPMHPPTVALAGRLTVHYAPPGAPGASLDSWQGIGEWYTGLSHDRLAASPEIVAKAAELTAGKTDFYDKAEAIGEFVQKQIRYFVIEMGIGGDQPHPAADIFHNRYGDCKDKATLLSSMLSTVGIHSALMMVDDRRGSIDPDAPSTWGNHMIGAIQIPDGYTSPRLRSVITSKNGKRYLIFDPTWEQTPFGQLEHELQGSYGLLVEGSASQIVALPVLAPELSAVHRTATFQLQPDGSIKGDVVEKRFGDMAETMRRIYTSETGKEQKSYESHRLGEDFTSFHSTDFKIDNLRELNRDLTASFSLTAEGFGKTMGPLLMVRPRVLGSDGLWVDRKPRKIPIDLLETRLVQDDFTIELPEGYAVYELPEPVKFDAGFASYESASELTGNKLHYHRTYTVKEVTLPASKYADLQKLAQIIEADEQNRAVLKKK